METLAERVIQGHVLQGRAIMGLARLALGQSTMSAPHAMDHYFI